MDKSLDDELCKAVLSKANGCESREVVEEYALDDNGDNIKLVKKKVTTKYLPPDISAVKMLLNMAQGNAENYANMTDEELISEKNRLLNILKDMEDLNGDCQDETQD